MITIAGGVFALPDIGPWSRFPADRPGHRRGAAADQDIALLHLRTNNSLAGQNSNRSTGKTNSCILACGQLMTDLVSLVFLSPAHEPTAKHEFLRARANPIESGSPYRPGVSGARPGAGRKSRSWIPTAMNGSDSMT